MRIIYVYVAEGEELNKVEEGYRRSGLPGCVGSMDCTHVVWDRAAKKVNNMCKRSGKAATLSFEVVVDHFRRIHHVSKSFYASSNDKHVMYHDTYPYDLSFDKVHMDRVTQSGMKPSGKVHGLLRTMTLVYSVQITMLLITMKLYLRKGWNPCVRILNAPLEEFSNNAFVYLRILFGYISRTTLIM